MLERLNLDDKVVLVTGGGTGLGFAMVMALAEAGANLVIAGRRQQPIDDAADSVKTLGRDAVAISADVSDSGQVTNLISKALSHYGRIDVLINNAALVSDNVRKPIWEISDSEWQGAMEVNLNGAFYCSREVSKCMSEAGSGKIINVASGFGLRGGRDIYMYCVSKGAIIQLTRVLSFSLARYGITANTIAPGFIPTESTNSDFRNTLPPSGDFLPIGKLGIPEQLGPVAVLLSSSASDYMTGEVMIVDGGGLAAGVIPTGYSPIVALED